VNPAYGGVPYASGYAYRPSANRWRQLPAMDVGRSAHVAVWTDIRMLVWGGYTVTDPSTGFLDGATY
jgi:hypothetical protein